MSWQYHYKDACVWCNYTNNTLSFFFRFIFFYRQSFFFSFPSKSKNKTNVCPAKANNVNSLFCDRKTTTASFWWECLRFLICLNFFVFHQYRQKEEQLNRSFFTWQAYCLSFANQMPSIFMSIFPSCLLIKKIYKNLSPVSIHLSMHPLGLGFLLNRLKSKIIKNSNLGIGRTLFFCKLKKKAIKAKYPKWGRKHSAVHGIFFFF